MVKMHKKFDDDGATVTKNGAGPGLSRYVQELNKANTGLKRDSERNPKYANDALPASQKSSTAHEANGFYPQKKKQKFGGGSFQPRNNLKETPGMNGRVSSGPKGLTAKPGLKVNPSNPSSFPKYDSGSSKAQKIQRNSNSVPNVDLGSSKTAAKTDSSHITSKPDSGSSKPAAKTDSSHIASKPDLGSSKAAPKTDSSHVASKSDLDSSKATKASSNTGSDNKAPKTDSSHAASKIHADSSKTSKTDPHNIASVSKFNSNSSKAIAKSGPEWKANGVKDGPGSWKLRAQELRQTKLRKEKFQAIREKLPIWSHRADVRWYLRKKDILLLSADTGSGKSTQVPQFLCDQPWCVRQKFQVGGRDVAVGGVIAITQPRRIAVTTLARRVAEEMGYKIKMDQGCPVGYAVRFDKHIPRGMKIKFLTEGMLLQELLVDPDLKQYSAVVVDEIHERTLDVDLVTGFLKTIVTGDKKGRHGVPLKVVVMSATAKMDQIREFFDAKPSSRRLSDISASTDSTHTSYSSWSGFGNDDGVKEAESISDDKAVVERNSDSSATLDEGAPVIATEPSPAQPAWMTESSVAVYHVPGKQYPVKDLWLEGPVADYLDVMRQAIEKIHMTKPLPGDILCFLTGQDEIETMQRMVEKAAATYDYKKVPHLQVMPLYGKQTAAEQQAVFEPLKAKRTRKVVLATNIAETSLTVHGVLYVVDCGKAKIKHYRHQLGLESLLVKNISQSSALQRKGRAGREKEGGECYHLYAERFFEHLPVSDIPEILRGDIVTAVLTMKARGVKNPLTFPLMDPPERSAVMRAMMQLLTLGAISPDGALTEIGKKIARFPISPAYGRVLVAAAAEEYDCVLEAVDVIACVTVDSDIFRQPTSEKQREETQSARESLNRREGDILTILTTIRRYLAQPSKSKKDRQTWCEQHQVSYANIEQALQIRKQLQDLCIAEKMVSAIPADSEEIEPITEEKGQALLKCFLKAFAEKTATLHPDKSYRTTGTRDIIAIHPGSVMQGKKCEAILFLEQTYTSKHWAKKVNMVQTDWVMEALAAQKT